MKALTCETAEALPDLRVSDLEKLLRKHFVEDLGELQMPLKSSNV